MITHQFFDYKNFEFYARNLCQYNNAIWLDSADKDHINSHFSFVMIDPLEAFNSNSYDTDFLSILKNHTFFSQDFQNKLKTAKQSHKNLPPFIGGFCGYFSYDYSVWQRFKIIPPSNNHTTLPHIWGGIYDCILYANHKTHQAGIIALSLNNNHHQQTRIDAILTKANQKTPLYENKNLDIQELSQTNYVEKVNRIIDYIKQGDIFQANITRPIQLSLPDNFSPFNLYQSLRNINAAPFGIYINNDNFHLLSASPERFLKIYNDVITVEPIKGTIASHHDKNINQQRQEYLKHCPKNRAENIMIVDLLRNDITPYCQVGTIKVEQLCHLHTFKGLHHLISKITGIMKHDAHVIDILKMALPAGSITGAPKKRACEIIYEQEASKRHAYCGVAGYIGLDGQSDMNVLIRTLQIDKNNITFNAGCGITAQSDAYSEYEETQVKLIKIIQSLKNSLCI